MATLMLSQHSSNPLELPTSDPRSRSYRRQAQRALGNNDSSEDPHFGYQKPEVQKYQKHLAQLFPELTTPGTDTMDERQDNINEYLASDDVFDVAMGGQDDVEDFSDADGGDEEADAEGETDEELSIFIKSREEREEIQEEIADLNEAVPQLAEDYKVIDRLGTGTFSSVYKAIDLRYHDKWDNAPWHGYHPASSSANYQSVPRPLDSKVFVAIKRIYVTSNPERIRNEIAIMEDCRGARHVSQLITAFRHEDQVVAIMPHHRNVDFREFYRTLTMEGIKAYFRCMFRALRDIHARGIIHRDVKPANFLFDPRTGIGTLCDFGLACRMEPGPSQGACLHTPSTREFPHGKIRQRGEYDIEHIKKMQKEARLRSSWPSEKVGYPDKDTRPHSKANRAGTRGFRAPEVLLKCGDQTGAIDVWSAGMILLFFLTGKFPLLQSSDDIEALMEIAAIIGRRQMEKAATLHSRTFATNVPSISAEGITWREFVERQNPNLKTPPEPDPQYYPYFGVDSHSLSLELSSVTPRPGKLQAPSPESHAEDVDCAFDLLEQIMQPESTRRITPRSALYHPFLAGADEAEDDEVFPHPFGEGVCGGLHFRDDVTEEPCVRIAGEDGEFEVRRLVAGEGIAIGREPCEFHYE